MPTPLFQTIAALAKGTKQIAHEITLLSAEVRTLRAANEAFSKRQRAKKACVCERGALTVKDAQDFLLQKDAKEQARRNLCAKKNMKKKGQSSKQRCRTCGNADHNVQTCQEVVDVSSSLDLE